MNFKIIVSLCLLFSLVSGRSQRVGSQDSIQDFKELKEVEMLLEELEELEDLNHHHHCNGRAVKCGHYCCDWAAVECNSGPVCCDDKSCGCSEENCQYGQDRVFLSLMEKIKKGKCEAGSRIDCDNDCKGQSAQCDNGMCCRCSGGGCVCCDDGKTCAWAASDCDLTNVAEMFEGKIQENTVFEN